MSSHGLRLLCLTALGEGPDEPALCYLTYLTARLLLAAVVILHNCKCRGTSAWHNSVNRPCFTKLPILSWLSSSMLVDTEPTRASSWNRLPCEFSLNWNQESTQKFVESDSVLLDANEMESLYQVTNTSRVQSFKACSLHSLHQFCKQGGIWIGDALNPVEYEYVRFSPNESYLSVVGCARFSAVLPTAATDITPRCTTSRATARNRHAADFFECLLLQNGERSLIN